MKRTPLTRNRLMLATCLWLGVAGIANAQDWWHSHHSLGDDAAPVAATAAAPATPSPAPRSAAEARSDSSATAALAASAAAAAKPAVAAEPVAVAKPVAVAVAAPAPVAVPAASAAVQHVAPPASAPAPAVAAASTAALVPATPEAIAAAESRLDALQREINEQTQRLGMLRQSLAQQEQNVAQLQRAIDEERLEGERGAGVTPSRMVPSLSQQTFVPVVVPEGSPQVAQAQQQQPSQQPAPQQQQAQPQQQQQQQPVAQESGQKPVGQAPEQASRPPEVAQIFDQPGVLTPAGKFVLEPSLQHGYSANDRVALVGFTVIPAILIGLIDVRQVKTTSGVATVTGRYGFGGRFELEAKVPYVYLNADTVSREIFTGTAVDNVFNASGRGMGDIEATARYQLNRGGPDKAFYIGWLRYKSRTGKDIFDVVTDCVTRCVSNATGTGLPLELPTGTGFQAVQPGVTWLFPSDPVVFFGSISYLYNFERKDVSRTVLLGGTEPLGDVKAGDIWGFNLGMGLALNEKASISLGYDTSLVGKTEQNGKDSPGSVRVTLGTMLLGGTYRFNDKVSLNVALGVGVTRDTPDVTFTARVPISF